MIQFAISNVLNGTSATYPHKDIQKETWYSADGMTVNQIDHILMSNRFRRAIRIKETKQQLTEKDEGTETFKNVWYNEECKFAKEEMKKATEKLSIKGRIEKEGQEYHHKRKEAHKIIRDKKKTYTKNITD